MILAKAPLRISLFGGGSDIPAHYNTHSGATLSFAIDKFVYVSVMETPHNHIKVSYSEQEIVDNVDDIKNEIVREALKEFGITSNIEITTFADIPTVGTGLGGSSAFTCALVTALARLKGITFGPYEIADLACYIEIERCGWNIGKQDQYASAFGGMNFIEYSQNRISVSNVYSENTANYCVLIPTNISRKSNDIINSIDIPNKIEVFRALANQARVVFKTKSLEFYSVSLSLALAWDMKKKMSLDISNPQIDHIYQRAMSAGAESCKLLGAGGGGYMLALTKHKDKIHQEFGDRTCLEVKVAYDGARVVYVD